MKEQGQAIQDAIKETGKIQHSNLENIYAKEDEWGVLHWYSINDTSPVLVKLSDILSDNWQPYPNKKEIRPERAGELWGNKSGNYGHTFKHPSGKIYFTDNEDTRYTKELIHVIHGLNGWKLIYSPDEEVMAELEGEKVVIEGVEFLSRSFLDGGAAFVAIKDGAYALPDSLKIGGKLMTMTLAYPKNNKAS